MNIEEKIEKLNSLKETILNIKKSLFNINVPLELSNHIESILTNIEQAKINTTYYPSCFTEEDLEKMDKEISKRIIFGGNDNYRYSDFNSEEYMSNLKSEVQKLNEDNIANQKKIDVFRNGDGNIKNLGLFKRRKY